MSEPKRILVIDLETSGSDKWIDYTLEIGAIVADMATLEEIAAFSCVINPDLDFLDQAKGRPSWRDRILGNPVVARMHTENGLLADAVESGVKLSVAEDTFLSFLADHGQKGEFMPLGGGFCHFDRPFVDRDLPRVSAWLTRRSLDVGDFRRRLQMAGREDLVYTKGAWKAHRALPDAGQHLAEARDQLRLLQTLPAPEATPSGRRKA